MQPLGTLFVFFLYVIIIEFVDAVDCVTAFLKNVRFTSCRKFFIKFNASLTIIIKAKLEAAGLLNGSLKLMDISPIRCTLKRKVMSLHNLCRIFIYTNYIIDAV